MDFIAEAFSSNKLTEMDCNNFIGKVKAAGSKLPVNSISEYLKNYQVRKV